MIRSLIFALVAFASCGFSIRHGAAYHPTAGGGGGAISVKSTAWKAVTNSTSVAVTVAPTAGNTLFVSMNGFNGTIGNYATTDNIGSGTWTRLPDSGTTSGGVKIARFVQFNVPAGITTVTCNGGTGTGALTIIIHEIVNVTSYTTGEQSNATFTATTNPQTTAVTNATANSVAFACLDCEASGTVTLTPNQTGSNPLGWAHADATHSLETNGTLNVAASVAFLVVSSSASTIHGWTISSSAGVKTLCFFH